MKALTPQAILRNVRCNLVTKIESGYHGNTFVGCEPDEYHFRKSYGHRAFDEREQKRIVEAIGTSNPVRFDGISFFVKK